jgi:hypothetical protein
VSDLDKSLLAVAGTFLAALLGYWLGRQRWLDEKRDRRRDLATGLLIELRQTEGILREMYDEKRPLDYRWIVFLPWFEKLFPDTHVFSPETTQAAYQFYGLVLEIESRTQQAREFKEIKESDHWVIRVKAGAAVQRMAHLVRALETEGGVLPPMRDVQLFEPGELPRLPERIFPPLGM